MKFDTKKFEKHVKNSFEKETKKVLQKKGIKNIQKIGSKGILPFFKGDIDSDSLLLK